MFGGNNEYFLTNIIEEFPYPHLIVFELLNALITLTLSRANAIIERTHCGQAFLDRKIK